MSYEPRIVLRTLGAIRTRTNRRPQRRASAVGLRGRELRAEDSNLQPPGPEPGVLPDCTSPHGAGEVAASPAGAVERLPGLEPGTSTLATSRSTC